MVRKYLRQRRLRIVSGFGLLLVRPLSGDRDAKTTPEGAGPPGSDRRAHRGISARLRPFIRFKDPLLWQISVGRLQSQPLSA